MVAFALVLVLGLGVARALGDRRRSPTRTPKQRKRRSDDPQLNPQDELELERDFAAAAAEGAHTLESLIDVRLQQLCSRAVPLRAIHAAPGPHTGRLAFADSTVLLARARRPGELYRLALSLPEHSLTINSWTRELDGTVLRFSWEQQSAELVVIGLDQAD